VQLTLGQTMQRWRQRDENTGNGEKPKTNPSRSHFAEEVDVSTPAVKDPRRIYVPDDVMAGYSPLQKQYWGT
jgi:hypothetical protein